MDGLKNCENVGMELGLIKRDETGKDRNRFGGGFDDVLSVDGLAAP